eukprot:m.201535 g.201535  ORF g.201535 m.201535 type:complete len:519 (-) comp21455_c0_seq1:19-1575(-)
MARDGPTTASISTAFSPASLALGALMMLLLGVNLGKLLGQSQNGDAPLPSSRMLVPVDYPTADKPGLQPEGDSAPRPPCKDNSDNNAVVVHQSLGTTSKQQAEPWATVSQRLMQPLRVHGPDGKVAPDASTWYGDAREGMPTGLTGREGDLWRKYPGPKASFYPASRDAAFRDPRGMVFGGGHGGLGNQLWAAAGVISVGLVTNRLPVLSCGSCYRHEALREIHCVPTKRGHIDVPAGFNKSGVGWGEGLMASPRDVEAFKNADTKVLSISGWLQSWQNFADHWETVCAALRPRREIQLKAQAFFDRIIHDNNVTLTPHTRTVTMHLRRGDYTSGKGPTVHGAMTLEYYKKGLEMLRSKLLKLEPKSAAEGMLVIVMTEAENVDWCRKNMNWGAADGVSKTICAIPEGSRCKGEIVDMLAIALGDFLIIANSSFSWWSSFFVHCIRELDGWWEVADNTTIKRSKSSFEAVVMPFRWYTGRLNRLRPKTYDLIQTNALLPEPSELFEGQKELLEATTKK